MVRRKLVPAASLGVTPGSSTCAEELVLSTMVGPCVHAYCRALFSFSDLICFTLLLFVQLQALLSLCPREWIFQCKEI